MSQLALISCCHIVALSDVNSISYVKSAVFFVERYTNAKYYYYYYYFDVVDVGISSVLDVMKSCSFTDLTILSGEQ